MVVDVPRCPIHHPLINRAAAALKRAVQQTRLRCYHDESHTGLLRALQVVVERSSQRAQVVVVSNTDSAEPMTPLLQRLANELGEELHSLWWNGNPERTNRVLGPLWLHWSGAPAVVETVGGAQVHFPPGAFGQNNLDAADELQRQIASWLPPGEDVVELYSGVGALGLGLLASGMRAVTFNEVSPDSLRGLRMGLERLPEHLQRRATVVEGRASLAAPLLTAESTLLVDPPRKGLEPELLTALCRVPPRRLIYVSCGLDTFLSDAAELLRNGLALVRLQAHDFFPFTPHLETLALFERVASHRS